MSDIAICVVVRWQDGRATFLAHDLATLDAPAPSTWAATFDGAHAFTVARAKEVARAFRHDDVEAYAHWGLSSETCVFARKLGDS